MLHNEEAYAPRETLSQEKASPNNLPHASCPQAQILATDPNRAATGKLQLALLQQCGLAPQHKVVDIFYGESSLAPQWHDQASERYQGIDLAPAAWLAGLKPRRLPFEDSVADFVCLFSVTRILSQQATFALLKEAERILKPGGKIVLSFLEFMMPQHWALFAASTENPATDSAAQLLTREALGAWASKLSLSIDGLHDANTPHINLRTPVVGGDGNIMERYGSLFESVCLLKKPDRVRRQVSVDQLGIILRGTPPNMDLRIHLRGTQTDWPEHIYLFAKDAYDDQLYTLVAKQFIPAALKNLQPLPLPTDPAGEIQALAGPLDFPYGARLEIYLACGSGPEQSYLSGNYKLIYCAEDAHSRPAASAKYHSLSIRVTAENFDEHAYIVANPDIDKEVREGKIESGTRHYQRYGQYEQRCQRDLSDSFFAAKAAKLQRIAPLLKPDASYAPLNGCLDFLPADLRKQFGTSATDAVSENTYDKFALQMIEELADGLILDCGSGRRPVYYENVVNFELVDYDTTDVRGMAESLPFIDGAFDAVISLAVLEHVKNPFACAKEICRVLKPGGKLICAVPFLQPFHAYPHHYYNMTSQGLANLFADDIHIDKMDVYGGLLPISSLTWIIKSWADGLQSKTRNDFLNMRIAEFLRPMEDFLILPFVTELPAAKNMELASAIALFGRKIT